MHQKKGKIGTPKGERKDRDHKKGKVDKISTTKREIGKVFFFRGSLRQLVRLKPVNSYEKKQGKIGITKRER